MEEEFRALLRGDTAVAAIAGARVHWGAVPQGTAFPRLLLTVVDDIEGATLAGGDGLFQGRVQVDCDADDYGTAKRLGRAVRAVLHGYRGGGFRGVFEAGARDGREGGSNEADRPFRVSLDFLTYWSAT